MWTTGYIHNSNRTERVQYTFNLLEGQYKECDRYDPIFYKLSKYMNTMLYSYGDSQAGYIVGIGFEEKQIDINMWSISEGEQAKFNWSRRKMTRSSEIKCRYCTDDYIVIENCNNMFVFDVKNGGYRVIPSKFTTKHQFNGNFLFGATKTKDKGQSFTICHLPTLAFKQYLFEKGTKIVMSYINDQQIHVVTYCDDNEKNELWTFG